MTGWAANTAGNVSGMVLPAARTYHGACPDCHLQCSHLPSLTSVVSLTIVVAQATTLTWAATHACTHNINDTNSQGDSLLR